MRLDPKAHIRPWQTALLSATVATGLVLVIAPQLAVGATEAGTTPVAAVSEEPAPVDVPLIRSSAPEAQRIVKAPAPLELKPVTVVSSLPSVAGVTAPVGAPSSA